MTVKIIYSTEALIHRNSNQIGRLSEAHFPSVDAAKDAPLPPGYVFALIEVENGQWVYSNPHGWEFVSEFRFTDSERAYFKELRGLANDQYGREVLVGLTLEETAYYIGYARARIAGTHHQDDGARYLVLDEKYELARLAVLGAEIELRNDQPPLH